MSRQIDLTATPAIVTVGSIHGGVRGNIIPDQVEMSGTIRVLHAEARKDIHARIARLSASNSPPRRALLYLVSPFLFSGCTKVSQYR